MPNPKGDELTADEIAGLRELLDRKQITERIYLYGRGVDRADLELFKSVFWEDGRFEGGPVANLLHDVADEIINVGVVRRFSDSHHLFGNILMQFEDAKAHVETYTIAYHRTFPNRESIEELIGNERLAAMGGRDDISYDLILGVRYVDLWEKRRGEWKILVRKIVRDWSITQPSTTLERGGFMQHLRWAGMRGSDDPSYWRSGASG